MVSLTPDDVESRPQSQIRRLKSRTVQKPGFSCKDEFIKRAVYLFHWKDTKSLNANLLPLFIEITQSLKRINYFLRDEVIDILVDRSNQSFFLCQAGIHLTDHCYSRYVS